MSRWHETLWKTRSSLGADFEERAMSISFLVMLDIVVFESCTRSVSVLSSSEMAFTAPWLTGTVSSALNERIKKKRRVRRSERGRRH